MEKTLTRSAPATIRPDNQKQPSSVILPVLKLAQQHASAQGRLPLDVSKAPKRYEETRSAVVQDFNHNRILVIGQDVKSRLITEMEQRLEDAVREAEAKLRLRAETEQAIAIQELRRAMTAEREEDLLRLEQQLLQQADRQLQEQEVTLRQEAIEEAERQRQEAQRRLQAALDECERKWRIECRRREEKARAEEIEKSEREKEQMRRDHEAAMAAAARRAEREKQAALEELSHRKDLERQEAVRLARLEEQDIAEKRLQEERRHHEVEVAQFNAEIRQLQHEACLADEEFIRVKLEKARVEEEVLHLREQFEDFLHRTLQQEDGHASHLVPLTEVLAQILTEKTNASPNTRDLILKTLSTRPSSAGTVELQPIEDYKEKLSFKTDFV